MSASVGDELTFDRILDSLSIEDRQSFDRVLAQREEAKHLDEDDINEAEQRGYLRGLAVGRAEEKKPAA